MASEKPDKFVEWQKHKQALFERVLGPMHGVVLHAIVPYAVGGALDGYLFPHGISGTGVATFELSEEPKKGPSNSVFRSYELVMFTRHPFSMPDVLEQRLPFGRAYKRMRTVLNNMARYSAMAKLDPGNTCEFPDGFGELSHACFFFVGYGHFNNHLAKDFGLLAVLEIHRTEMQYAMKNGSAKLLAKLKEKGFYPYSDLDRQAVA